MNITSESLDLSGVTFTRGLKFTFAANTPLLPPNGRILVVKNAEAFEFRYADAFPLNLAGEFTAASGLSNDGELIELSLNEEPLLSVTYNDVAPWPTAADGHGYALVLIHPQGNPNLSDPANWRSGARTPGTTDATTFTAFAAANGITSPWEDHDGDGIPALFEYATGLSVNTPNDNRLLRVEKGATNFSGEHSMLLEFPVAPAAEDIILIPEASSSLINWEANSTGFEFLGETRDTNGQAIRRYRWTSTPETRSQQFFRLHATQR